MIVFDPGAGEPERWVVCFCRKAATPWMQRLPIGRYKHVRAFGCVVPIKTWIFFDPAMNRTTIRLARGDVVRLLMMEFLAEADAITVATRPRVSFAPRFGGWCVPAVRHVLGLPGRGALRPSAFFDELLRQGGEILPHASPELPAAAD